MDSLVAKKGKLVGYFIGGFIMKKVLSILLVVIMVMGVSSGVVFADDVLPEDPDFEMELWP